MSRSTVTPPGDTSAAGAAATPDPGATFSPGRFVNSCSRAAALLQATGLAPTAIPRAVEGGSAEVTQAEVEAELTRRGIVVELPKPLPPLSEAKARGITQRQLGLAMPLHKLRPGRKAPLESGWMTAPPLTEDEATQWLSTGGNIGTVPAQCGENGWLMVDAENEAATKVFEAAGLVPLARTAKSQHPLWPEKAGGAHFIVPLPEDVDPATLDNVRQAALHGGGLVDLLFNTNCVLAGSRLDCAPGTRYELNLDGPACNPELLGAVDVRWLFDKSAPLPEVAPEFRDALAALHGKAVKPVRTPRPFDPNADRITQEVDAIPVGEWLAGYEDKIQITGIDGGCGCPVFGWHSSGSARSGILHEDCEIGFCVKIFSTTMQGELDCPEAMSRLGLRTYLEGRSLGDVARDFGISLGDELTGVDLSGFTYRPADAEPPSTTASTSPVIGVNYGVPEDNTRHLKAVPRIGTVGGNQATAAIDSTAVDSTGGTATAATTAVQEDTGLAMYRRHDEITASGFWNKSSFLKTVYSVARSNGVYEWGLLGAVLPRIACNIPPHVRLVNSSGREGGRSSGTSLNLANILFGAPEAGKSETIKVAEDLIALPAHAKSAGSGTGEGIIKSFAYMKKASGKGDSFDPAPPDPAVVDPSHPGSTVAPPQVGSVGGQVATGANSYEMVSITDTVMLTIPEISDMTSEMNRQGTKLSSVIRKGWMGEAQGSTTGEIERRTHLNPHSYRLGIVIGSQVVPEILDPILGEDGVGTPQRLGYFPAKTVPVVGDPVTQITLPSIDWFGGQAAAAYAAQLTGSVAPTWIRWSPDARREIEAAKAAREETAHLAFSVQEAQRHTEQDELFSTPRGHELLHQLKLAAVLAIGEGLAQFEDRHWALAAKIMEARGIVLGTVMAVLDVKRQGADRRLGQTRGRMQAAAKIAEADETQAALQSVCDTIVRLVDAAANPDYDPEIRDKVAAAVDSNGKITSKGRIWSNGGVHTGYLRQWITSSQRGLIERALIELRRAKVITTGHIFRRVPAVPHAVQPANVS